jgi:pyruvate dehydrogenase E1 component beta subunit
MAGLRPVVELMTVNFALLAFDQIINHAAAIPYMFNGQVRVPMVIRMPGGGGHQLGPTHSHSFEAMFLQIPGLLVACPSTAADGKGLLKTAIRDDNPVMFFTDMTLGYERGNVAGGEHLVPLGEACVRRSGRDLTLISYSKAVHACVAAAQQLEGMNVSAEVLDLRTLKPLDEAAILASVRKTGRVLIVHEASGPCGVGAEIAALVAEKAFRALKAPVLRLTGPDAPAPSSYALEQAFMPQPAGIVAAAKRLLAPEC